MVDRHNLIANRDDVTIEQQTALSRIQARCVRGACRWRLWLLSHAIAAELANVPPPTTPTTNPRFRAERERSTHIKRAREGKPVCPFLRTPERAVEAMLRLSAPTETDLVYDLGCGDGAISLEVARARGARCVGFDIDEVHLASARTAAEAHDMSALLE